MVVKRRPAIGETRFGIRREPEHASFGGAVLKYFASAANNELAAGVRRYGTALYRSEALTASISAPDV